MPNFNQATIIGHVGRDPETRYTPDGKAICNFSVAYTRKGKEEKTTWFKCSAFGKQSEVIQQYVQKGNAIMVVGPVELDVWKDKDGGEKSTLTLTVREFALLGGKGEEAKPAKAQQSAPQQNAPQFDESDDIPFN